MRAGITKAGRWSLLLGTALLGLKALLPETIDDQGFLQEAFFLLPLGFSCLFLGAGLLGAGWLLRKWKK